MFACLRMRGSSAHVSATVNACMVVQRVHLFGIPAVSFAPTILASIHPYPMCSRVLHVRSLPPVHAVQIIDVSRCHKGRLLIYFPYTTPAETTTSSTSTGAGARGVEGKGGAIPSEAETSSWCGWHNDHGSLTGLCPAMFFDSEGKEIPCPDPKAGLYIRSRQGRTVRVTMPADCVAYQIGETAQVHTGGILQATPHCVQAANVPGVSRGTLAVFMEPEWDEAMETPSGADKECVLRGARGELLPKGVPPLVDRWLGGDQTFGAFTDRTLSMYY